MMRKRSVRRRATILVMVVSVLALLFVIVSGYLALARFDRENLTLAQQGQVTDAIIDNVNDLVLSLMREQWADANGDLLAGKDPEDYAYADIPGYRKSHWLAALEPVLDRSRPAPSLPNRYGMLEEYVWPAVSSFEALADNDPYRQPTIKSLMLKQWRDESDAFTVDDVERNARLAFMDADGDGAPDAGLLASARATELANGLAGAAVRLRGTGIVSDAIPPDGDNGAMDDFWRRYDGTARYEVAVRVVPHGGMVALSSPGQYGTAQAWNRQFVTGMFNWVCKDNDALRSDEDELFNKMSASASAIEPLLRRRNLLAAYRDPDFQDDFGRVPDTLRVLEERFPSTFVPQFDFGANRKENWQRFNLGERSGYQVWRWSTATHMDPYAYNRFPGDRDQPRRLYDTRHLLTTVSYSDELARKLAERDLDDPLRPLGTYQGQAKFYLGEIEKCFTANGYFLNSASTRATIKRLADMYYDMLSGHKFSGELYQEKDQAYMLAVNTVAFAAPRVPLGDQYEGFVDVVLYGFKGGKTYVGYGPQPFITQLLAYAEYEDGETVPDVALAVEVYNPHEALVPGDLNDPYALNLSQFVVSLNGADPNVSEAGCKLLSEALDVAPARLPGRTFLAFAYNDMGSNGELDSAPGIRGVVSDVDVTLVNNGVTVKLWRGRVGAVKGSPGWYLVDQMEVNGPAQSGPGGGGSPSPAGREKPWSADVARDTTGDSFFGDVGGVAAARWRTSYGFLNWSDTPSALKRTRLNGKPNDQPSWIADNQLGGPGGPGYGTTGRSAPTVPLCTMNAFTEAMGAERTNIHGADRPNSFPSAGFLLFVPRYSHVIEAGQRKPVTQVLREAWKKHNYSVVDYPVDFGHMPAFDNRQNAADGGLFKNSKAGRIPWGLLVFDYFTTLDPAVVNPRRVPGRINVNSAPWYVLAGLPVIGPDVLGGDLPLHTSASPAFWRAQSGILAGFGLDAFGGELPRSPVYSNSSYPTPLTAFGGWWRLGSHLAASVAEYRDRIAYLDRTRQDTAYKGSYLRNDTRVIGGAKVYRDVQRYGDIRRGRGTLGDPDKYGLLTLGELANVKGFDAALYDEQTDDPLVDPLGLPDVVNDGGDYMRAVSLLALLDTHFLTTRSNTFTVYVTVRDRKEPQRSVRSQLTVDRGNLLPRLSEYDDNGDGIVDRRIVIQPNGKPRIIAEHRSSYYNARFDD